MPAVSPLRFSSTAFRDERGTTLIEMLVTTISGVVVMLALFAVLDFSINQSGRLADRAESDQQGRPALEKIMQELHSSCLAASVTPVQEGSDDTGIRIISDTGAQAAFLIAHLHYIHLTGGELIDNSYQSTTETPPEWSFPSVSETPTNHQTLLTNVSQSRTGSPPAEVPIFQYFRYYTSADKGGTPGEMDPTPLSTPLSKSDAANTAEVTVTFTANPSSGSSESGRSANFSDSAVLRFDPSSGDPTANNASCT
jgi:hypothetical protein